MLTTTHAIDDPYLWLEEVQGARALEFVAEANARTTRALESTPTFEALRREILEVLDSRERIPYVVKRGPWLYNFWQDAQHPRGLWRRTSLDEYRKPTPVWDVLIDLDALASAERENWVWAGVQYLEPSYDKCTVMLSRGGGDAVVVREFDPINKRFVRDGFELPEAKSAVTWRDANTLYVATDCGPESLTTSGYPRTIRRWSRGQQLSNAPVVFEGERDDVSVSAWVEPTPGWFREGFVRSIAFYRSQTFVMRDGQPVRVDVPDDAEPELVKEWMYVRLRSDWTVSCATYPAGALIAIRVDDFLAGKRVFDVLFAPEDRVFLADYSLTRDAVLLDVLDNVRGRVIELKPTAHGWERRTLQGLGHGQVQAHAFEPYESNDYLLSYKDFLTPDTLMLGEIGSDKTQVLKSLPAFFDAQGMVSMQHEAVSADGTRVPYFVVGRASAIASGQAPTLLYGYGGFEVTLEPWYSGTFGRAWLAKGGVFAVANIRGGGEFGPGWHQAALTHRRERAFEDFEAVAADLVARGTTTSPHLGIMGGSNGGLLVAAVMLRRPELFGAVVCQVPLLDMRRYHVLLAGASWMAEYGDPDDVDDWAVISRYSPYQNLRSDVRYPPVLFVTSTRDDRVHPGHARKMYARMIEQGHDALYFENTEGGHAGAADNRQKARMNALEFAFLWSRLQ
ncbi:MAG TPA: prolyl oligopeptidase family serine peptidase [Burkholderiaceae bacterium]|nr:prolyl oligopeptidase family serine peptidase [Burkholderiaceae bacterium]